jgi:hypothetical protein
MFGFYFYFYDLLLERMFLLISYSEIVLTDPDLVS